MCWSAEKLGAVAQLGLGRTHLRIGTPRLHLHTDPTTQTENMLIQQANQPKLTHYTTHGNERWAMATPVYPFHARNVVLKSSPFSES